MLAAKFESSESERFENEKKTTKEKVWRAVDHLYRHHFFSMSVCRKSFVTCIPLKKFVILSSSTHVVLIFIAKGIIGSFERRKHDY